MRSACPEVSIPPVLAGDTRCGSVPYYEQETNYTCGPAAAQMWIDFHNGYVSQDTLWNYILDSNREEGWYTDTYGLAACVSNYRSTGIERFRRYYGLSAEIIHVDTRSVGFPDIIHGRER